MRALKHAHARVCVWARALKHAHARARAHTHAHTHTHTHTHTAGQLDQPASHGPFGRKNLELGTFTGFSSSCIASALPPASEVASVLDTQLPVNP